MTYISTMLRVDAFFLTQILNFHKVFKILYWLWYKGFKTKATDAMVLKQKVIIRFHSPT